MFMNQVANYDREHKTTNKRAYTSDTALYTYGIH